MLETGQKKNSKTYLKISTLKHWLLPWTTVYPNFSQEFKYGYGVAFSASSQTLHFFMTCYYWHPQHTYTHLKTVIAFLLWQVNEKKGDSWELMSASRCIPFSLGPRSRGRGPWGWDLKPTLLIDLSSGAECAAWHALHWTGFLLHFCV